MVFYGELKQFLLQLMMVNNILYFTSMKNFGWHEGGDGEVGRRR